MPELPRTDREIAGLAPHTRLDYYDTHTAGLVLRLSGPTTRHDGRARTWVYRYRYQGRREYLTLGTYPDLKLKPARDAVLAARAHLTKGENPAAVRRTPAPAPPEVYTFAKFVPVFIAEQQGRIKTWQAQANKIALHLAPAWNDRALASLTRVDIAERLDTIAATGMTIGVNRILALVSKMFSVALDRGLIAMHPCARMRKRFTENVRDRVLSDDELRALWAGLTALPGAASDTTKLRLLLGQRGGETAGMRWDELDLVVGVWRLPRPRTKNKVPHVVPLPPLALAIVTARRAVVAADEPRVFPGLVLGGSEHKKLRGLHGGTYTWKDLRRTAGTRLGELGYSDEMIGRVLNHKKATITGKVYNHARYLSEIALLLTAWDRALTRVLHGEPMLERGKVLSFTGQDAR